MVATPSSPSVGNQSAVEMTLNSNRPFLPIGEMLVLTICDQTLDVSRYSDDGSTNQISIQYGDGNGKIWRFGGVDKKMLK